MKNAVIRARIDADLKAQASEVLASCGHGAGPGLSGAELARLKLQSQERDRRIAASEDVSGGEMFLIRPEKARAARIKWPDASLE
jgi:hypothetical protein